MWRRSAARVSIPFEKSHGASGIDRLLPSCGHGEPIRSCNEPSWHKKIAGTLNRSLLSTDQIGQRSGQAARG
jgi:hypothetical protein